jgi:AraC-like DNA-binding protein
MSVFAPSVASFWRQIEDYGIDAEPLFRKHGIPKSTLFDHNARISDLKIDRISAEVVKQTEDPFFGLKEEKYFLPSHMGPLGFAWLASTSLRSAMERLQRSIKVLHEQLEIEISEKPDTLIVSANASSPYADPVYRADAQLAILTRMCRFICGDEWNPVKVTYIHPSPADTSYYFQLFRCPVEFNAGKNSMHVDRQKAEQRLTGSNKQLAQLNDHIVIRYLASQAKADIVNKVKAAILAKLGEGSVTEATIADELHMSTRNLNRKLVAHNTSFKAVLLEIRSELASQYISDASLTLTEISYMLGFSEISSFSRAFKRWTGQSPSEARRDHPETP